MTNELKNHILKMMDKSVRYDGRKFDEYRDVKVEYDVVKNAEGSARVTMGKTVVIAGIKMSVEAPYPDRPDEGTLMVNTELSPLSNPEFEPGPPGIVAIELARVVDRGIRESEAVDFKKLCITSGEKAWFITIDVCPIVDEGNLFDVSSLAAIAALKTCILPKYDEESGIDYKAKSKTKIALLREPIEVTVLKLGEHLFVDPLTEEEKVADARLTVAVTEKGDVCALQKGGDVPLTVDEIMNMVDVGIKKSKDLRKKL